MTTTTSTSAPASASASSSSSFNPFKRRAQQKEGPSSSAKKSHRPRTMQQPRAPDRADTSQRSTPAPQTTTTTAAAAAATTTTTPVPLPRRTPTPPLPPSSSSSSSSSSSDPITQAYSSLTALQTQLDHLSTHFDLNPSTLHFSPPSSSSSNTDPKLPFVPQNASYHSYIEDLTKLLLKLDGIESNGDQGVRQRRKALVAAIERELEKVEAIKQREWHRRQQLEQELGERRGKVDEMMRRFKTR